MAINKVHSDNNVRKLNFLLRRGCYEINYLFSNRLINDQHSLYGHRNKNLSKKKVVKKYIKRLEFFLTLHLQMVSEKNGEKAMFYSTASTNYATIYPRSVNLGGLPPSWIAYNGQRPLWGRQLMKLQRNTHHVFRLMYHFVWIPKDRHKVFSEPYRSELKAIIQKIGYDYDIDIVELEVPVDHIHMVVRSEPKISPSKVMQVIKIISTREFFKLRPKIRRKYF